VCSPRPRDQKLVANWKKNNPDTPFPIRLTNQKKENNVAPRVKSSTVTDKGETKNNNTIANINYKKKMQSKNTTNKQTMMSKSLMSKQTLGA
tara:strand:+ start:571 stop:846 length:276 start_codon:yes stop_codon:yes gene_type:complete